MVVMVAPLAVELPVLVATRMVMPDDDVVMVAVAVDVDMFVRSPVAVAALVVLGRGGGRSEDGCGRRQDEKACSHVRSFPVTVEQGCRDALEPRLKGTFSTSSAGNVTGSTGVSPPRLVIRPLNRA
jgi:hypothetical protein